MRTIVPDCSWSQPFFCLLQKDGEIALFGGEFFDSNTDRQLVYGDLFVFNCSKERWRKVIIPHRSALTLTEALVLSTVRASIRVWVGVRIGVGVGIRVRVGFGIRVEGQLRCQICAAAGHTCAHGDAGTRVRRNCLLEMMSAILRLRPGQIQSRAAGQVRRLLRANGFLLSDFLSSSQPSVLAGISA